LHDERVGGVGEVAEGIDERAVEVEGDEPDHSPYSANDDGVSHIFTRVTGRPSLVAC
jgi:hypothetical protein